MTSANTLDVGDVVTDLLDGLHLLVQVVALDEVGHLYITETSNYLYLGIAVENHQLVNTNLEITVLVSDGMKVKQSLVHFTLQLESSLHGLKGSLPVILGWLPDVIEDDTTATFILELHQLLSMFLLLISSLLEVLGKARESNVMPLKVGPLEGEDDP